MLRVLCCLLWFGALLASNPPYKKIKKAPQIAPIENREALIRSVDHSLAYLKRKEAKFHFKKIPLDRVKKSLLRFKALLEQTLTDEAFHSALKREFAFFEVL